MARPKYFGRLGKNSLLLTTTIAVYILLYKLLIFKLSNNLVYINLTELLDFYAQYYNFTHRKIPFKYEKNICNFCIGYLLEHLL